jgi:putative SOS response-associated peptidase YedK
MCGRYTLRGHPKHLAQRLGLGLFEELSEHGSALRPRFNIAPSQLVAAVRRTRGKSELVELRWGLVPHWADDPAIGARLINARAETLASKPAFRDAFRRRRCLILADGFYEWQRQGARKQPYFITLRTGAPFAFAGLWERWEGPDGPPLESCVIITTQPNALVKPIHARMPVILDSDSLDIWLNPESAADHLQDLLRPLDPDKLEAHPVGPWVNSPKADDERCIKPRDESSPALDPQQLF